MYQVLARKWRPKDFASLKGQNHVTTALMNALSRQQLHHAYLFTGTRGVGKTSIARILAKALNCEQGITPTPCGQCSACVSIDQGTFVDLIEVDAASRTRVEDTRELLENVQYAPTQGRFKIYLIDEVHMLSTHSFNALLKTLEEPPSHVKFILATTDPDRIPMTILSRCLRLSLKALSIAELTHQCEAILQQEKQTFDSTAVRKIAQAANGSMRDALSLLEQAIAYGNGCIETAQVDEMLGMSYQQFMPPLLQALSEGHVKACLEVVEKMVEVAADFAQVLTSVLQTFHALAIAQLLPQESQELAVIADIDPALLVFKDKFTPEDVQLMYQIALNGQRDLPYAPSMRTNVEMTLLRMMVFKPQEAVVAVKAQVIAQAAPRSAPEQIPASMVAAKPAAASNVIVDPTEFDWGILSNQLPLSGFSRMIVKHSVVSKWDGLHLQLTLDSAQKACLNPQRQSQIQQAISQQLGRSVKVTITLGEVQAQSPIVQERMMVQEKQEKATHAVLDNQHVKDILSTFNATVEKIIVNPRDG